MRQPGVAGWGGGGGGEGYIFCGGGFWGVSLAISRAERV